MGPAETAAERPINESGFADDLFSWEIAPVSGVVAVHRIVAHDEIMVRTDAEDVGFGMKKRRDAWSLEFFADGFVDVAEVGVFFGCGLEGIDHLEVWC